MRMLTNHVNIALYVVLCLFHYTVADYLDYIFKIPPPNNVLRQFTCAYIYEDDVPFKANDSEEGDSKHPPRLIRKVDNNRAGYLDEDVEDSTNCMYGLKHLVKSMRQAAKHNSVKSIEYSKSNIKNGIQRLINNGKVIRDVREINISVEQSTGDTNRVRDIRAVNIDLKQSISGSIDVNTQSVGDLNKNDKPVEPRILKRRVANAGFYNVLKDNRFINNISWPGGQKKAMNVKINEFASRELGKYNQLSNSIAKNNIIHFKNPLVSNDGVLVAHTYQPEDLPNNKNHEYIVNVAPNLINTAVQPNLCNNKIHNHILREVDANNSLTSINMLPSSMNQPLPRVVTNINADSNISHDNLQLDLVSNNQTDVFDVKRLSNNIIDNNKIITINPPGDVIAQQRLQKEFRNNESNINNHLDKIHDFNVIVHNKTNKYFSNNNPVVLKSVELNNTIGDRFYNTLSKNMSSRLSNGVDDRINYTIDNFVNNHANINIINDATNRNNCINEMIGTNNMIQDNVNNDYNYDNESSLLSNKNTNIDNDIVMSSQKNNKKLNTNLRNNGNVISDILTGNNSLVGYLWTTINRFNRGGTFHKQIKTGSGGNFSFNNYGSTWLPKSLNALKQNLKLDTRQLINNLVVNMTLTDEVRINGTLNFNYDNKVDTNGNASVTENIDELTLVTFKNITNNNAEDNITNFVTTTNVLPSSDSILTTLSETLLTLETLVSIDPQLTTCESLTDFTVQPVMTTCSNDISVQITTVPSLQPVPVPVTTVTAVPEFTVSVPTTCVNVTSFRFYYNNINNNRQTQKVLNLDTFDYKNVANKDRMAKDSLFNVSAILVDKMLNENSSTQQAINNNISYNEAQLNVNAEDRNVNVKTTVDVSNKRQPSKSSKKVMKTNDDYDELKNLHLLS